ncbi:MAG: hypothetical protein LH473_01375, partial [Chitinophagales bacterium]|nr:hypothetical protein [Chitinophagales bacterium]
MRLDLNGNLGTGWPKQYGSSSNDIAYDIKEDHDGNYIVVGTAGTDDGTMAGWSGLNNAQDDGDIWVLKLSPGGSVLKQQLYYGANSGADAAHSVIVTCNNKYAIASFCNSCEAGDFTEDYLLEISNDLSSDSSVILGKSNKDQGSYNIIQVYSGIFGTCLYSDPYVSAGLSHTANGCLQDVHDFWATKTNNDLTDNTTFTNSCTDVDEGAVYGGTKLDDGFCAVQTCSGYVIVGYTKTGSNDNDVSCNSDGTSLYTEEIWMVKVNGSTGAVEWDESLGNTGDDGAYSIQR